MAIKEENSIGFRIVEAFNAKDLKEVAQTIGENYSSLHNWSSKRRDFPTNVLIKIAKMANTSIDWILTGENNRQETETLTFDKVLSEKIREIIKEEISEGTEIHEKIQGIVLAMQSNIKEQDIFKSKEEKAA
jgi:hypothetical protein